MLLTDDRPRYMSAKIIGGQGESSHFGETPPAGGEHKITARFLTPYLASLDNEGVPSMSPAATKKKAAPKRKPAVSAAKPKAK